MCTGEHASWHPDNLDKKVCSDTAARTPETIYGPQLRSVPNTMGTGDDGTTNADECELPRHTLG